MRKTKQKRVKPMTMKGLGRFTDEVILPGVERIVKGAVKDVKSDILEVVATKGDLADVKDSIIGEVQKENAKVIQSNDKVVTKLDVVIKELAAHDVAHGRIEDTLHNHKKRIEKLEGVVGGRN